MARGRGDRQRGVGRFFLHLYEDLLPCPPEELPERCSLTRARAWMGFTRGCEPVPPPETALRIEQVADADGANQFGGIVQRAFDLRPSLTKRSGSLSTWSPNPQEPENRRRYHAVF